MAQHLKDDIRARIEDAALELFSTRGFIGTSIAEVARAAGIATGNVYRYFADKQALFDAVVPAAFVAQWKQLSEARFAAAKLGLGDRWREVASAMQELALSERRRLLVLLRHAEGTPYAGFADALVELCSARCAEHFGVQVSRPIRLVYRNLFSAVAELLEHGTAEDFARYNAFHLGGLTAMLGAST